MTSAARTRVLVVAHRTAATPRLLDEVRARSRRSPCDFTLLVPRPYWDPETEEAAVTLELAIPLLDEATRAIFPYDNLDEIFEIAPVGGFPPLEDQGDGIVTYNGWLEAWERVRAA